MIECLFCEEVKGSLTEISEHIESGHPEEPFYTGPTGHSFTCYCDECGEEFSRGAAQISPTHFCSPECHTKYRSGGTQTYGAKFKKVRKQAFERDGGRCVDCGLSERVHLELYECGLSAHHIERVDSFDDPDNAHTLENVEMVCKQCHRIRHLREWEL